MIAAVLVAVVVLLVVPAPPPPRTVAPHRPTIPVPPRWAGGPGRRAVRSRWACTATVAVVVVLIEPVLVPVVPVVSVAVHRLRLRSAERRREAERAAELPEVLELVAVALRAGATVPVAAILVARRGPAAAAAAFDAALARVDAGVPFVEALDALPTVLGEAYRPLSAALVAAERDGAPLVAMVTRLAGDAHDARRRLAEARSRQVPVRLLLPLVCCTLPAVVVVTIVPLVAVSGGFPG